MRVQRLREEEIEYIVAPYEADAQLAYLSIQGIVDAIITEDSDMLPYGCNCILFKLDKYGNAQEIQTSQILECRSPLSFEKFTMKMFRQMCILSGCDYLPSPSGLGIRGAYNLMKQFKDYKSVISHIRETRSYILSYEYEQKFEEAELTYLYQRIWNPLIQEITHLHPLPAELSSKDLSFLGSPIDSELGYHIAKGLVNPITHEPWNTKNNNKQRNYSNNKPKLTILNKQTKSNSPCTPVHISVFHSKFLFFYFSHLLMQILFFFSCTFSFYNKTIFCAKTEK